MGKKWFALAMLSVLSLLGAFALLQEQLKPGAPAPDFELDSLDNQQVKLSELKGKPVFLDFWATWCGPCRRALPHTQAFSEKYKGKAHILAINVREDKETVREFMEKNRYTFRVLMDSEGMTARAYGVRGIPHFVVIDAKGKIAFIQIGYGPGVEEKLENALKKAIAQAEQKETVAAR
ncbi:Thiol-disulfide oxidoreductase ResA [bacterium HR15]|nr:Thiol-disulfide oxidoreductase ResA [bacterium HR15]